MATPLSSLKAGRYVRLEDLGGFPLFLTEVAKRTPLGPRPKAPGIYVDLRDPELKTFDKGPTADGAVLNALVHVGTEVTEVSRYVRLEELGFPVDLQALAARTTLQPLPKATGIYVDLSKALSDTRFYGESAALRSLIHVGTDVTEVGRYALASDVWEVILRRLHDSNDIRARTPLSRRPTSPGVYVNFSHPTLSSCLSKPSIRRAGRYQRFPSLFAFISVEAAMIESLTAVGSREEFKLGRFAPLDKAWPSFAPTLAEAEEMLMYHAQSTPLSHLPTAGGTYVNLADKWLLQVLKVEQNWKSRASKKIKKKQEEESIRRVEDEVIYASILVRDKRLFLVAAWLKERDWMLGGLRENEFRYLLEWVGTARLPGKCKLNGCPCGFMPF